MIKLNSLVVTACIWALAALLLGVGIPETCLGNSGMRARREAALDRITLEKKRAELAKIQMEVKDSSGINGFLANDAGFLTALAALGGVIIAVRGQNREHTRQREADRRERELARRQRRVEGERDVAERMSKLLLDLGSEREAIQAGAAVSLLSFLDQSPAVRRQVRLAALANLKVEHPDAVSKLLIRTFEEAVSNAGELPLAASERDLSGALLAGIKLIGLDLSDADISEANLTGADLSRSTLRGVRGKKAVLDRAIFQGAESSLFNAKCPDLSAVHTQFQGANLVNAHFEGSNLRNACFNGAKLQAAHLEYGADLRGARFEGANVADTYFRKAQFDDDALRSLVRADNWEKAHLSPADADRLRELAHSR